MPCILIKQTNQFNQEILFIGMYYCQLGTPLSSLQAVKTYIACIMFWNNSSDSDISQVSSAPCTWPILNGLPQHTVNNLDHFHFSIQEAVDCHSTPPKKKNLKKKIHSRYVTWTAMVLYACNKMSQGSKMHGSMASQLNMYSLTN